jgi:hypothetical protein
MTVKLVWGVTNLIFVKKSIKFNGFVWFNIGNQEREQLVKWQHHFTGIDLGSRLFVDWDRQISFLHGKKYSS